MKTRYTRMNQLAPILGIILVAAAVVGLAIYRDLERKIHAGEAMSATLDRLHRDQTVSAALKRIHEGDVAGAAQTLDLMLCDDILELNSKMASADNRQQAYTERMFMRIAQLRPSNAVIAAGTSREPYGDQIEAEKLLGLAAARGALVNNTVAASH